MNKEESLRLRQTVHDAFFKNIFQNDRSVFVIDYPCVS